MYAGLKERNDQTFILPSRKDKELCDRRQKK